MARGHPDWQTVSQTTLAIIKSFGHTAGTNTIWTPAAGTRIRVLAYHIGVTLQADGGASGGLAEVDVVLREAVSLVELDRWHLAVRAAASASKEWNIDGGLSVLPGGGWPVGAVNRALQLVVTTVAGGTATIPHVRADGTVAGLEE